MTGTSGEIVEKSDSKEARIDEYRSLGETTMVVIIAAYLVKNNEEILWNGSTLATGRDNGLPKDLPRISKQNLEKDVRSESETRPQGRLCNP